MANQFITYLGDARPLPMRSPEIESYKYRELGEIVQQNAKALGGSLDQYAEFERQKGQIQDIKNFLDSDSQIDSIVGEFKVKQAQNPLAYDKHKQWAGEAMKKIGGLKYTFSDELNATKFEAKKKGIITDFNIKTAIGIGDSELTDAKNIWQSNYQRQMKEGRYGDAKTTLAAGAGIFENPTIIENEIAGVDHTETLNIAGNDILKDPNDALKKLQGGHYKGLREDEVYNLSQEARKARAKINTENANGILLKQLAGEVVSDEEINGLIKSGTLTPVQARQMKKAEADRIKGIPKEHVSEIYNYTYDLIRNYNPAEDTSGEEAANIRTEITASNLPKGDLTELMNRLNDKISSGESEEKKIMSSKTNFVLDRADAMLDSGRLGNWGEEWDKKTYKERDLYPQGYKATKAFAEGEIRRRELVRDTEMYMKQNPNATDSDISSFMDKKATEKKAGSIPKISSGTAKAIKPDGTSPNGFGEVKNLLNLYSTYGGKNPSMSAPQKRPAAQQDNNGNKTAGSRIIQSEARRDKHGNITVYTPPAGDGGGAYEVAGINVAFHPKKAAEFKNLIEQGNPQEAEKRAAEYVNEYTKPVSDWLSSSNVSGEGTDYFLRDMYFNGGQGGALKVINRALGVKESNSFTEDTMRAMANFVSANGEDALLDKLKNSRESFYRSLADHNPEKEKFLDGWLNRTRDSYNAASEMNRGSILRGKPWDEVRGGLIAQAKIDGWKDSDISKTLSLVYRDWMNLNC